MPGPGPKQLFGCCNLYPGEQLLRAHGWDSWCPHRRCHSRLLLLERTHKQGSHLANSQELWNCFVLWGHHDFVLSRGNPLSCWSCLNFYILLTLLLNFSSIEYLFIALNEKKRVPAQVGRDKVAEAGSGPVDSKQDLASLLQALPTQIRQVRRESQRH